MAEHDKRARVISISDEQRRKARRVASGEVSRRATRSAPKASQGADAGSRRRRDLVDTDVAVADDEPFGLIAGVMNDPRLGRWLKFGRRRLEGRYLVDEYGYDEELTEEVLLPILRPLYHDYFRVEVRGIENVPASGPAILAANHSGTLPWDAAMLLVATHDEHDESPLVRIMGSGLVWNLPFVSEWARKAGGTSDTYADMSRILSEGEIISVFPEGSRALGKRFGDRYRLERFERQDFVKVALETAASIIPVGIVGAEETYPTLADARIVARVLGMPYFSLTPTFPWLGPLGLVPLPTKWIVEFGEPIDMSEYEADAAQDSMTVFNIADGVRDTIQQSLYRNLVSRRTWFW